jgi:hypothetical protein
MQPLLNIPIAARTVLVTTETVRAAKGVDADTIHALVDNGDLQWVWDISAPGSGIRDLRYWTREIIAPDTTRHLSITTVIGILIGTEKPRLRGYELCQLLLCSRPHLKRLVDAHELSAQLIGGTFHVSRPSLVQFLISRHQN